MLRPSEHRAASRSAVPGLFAVPFAVACCAGLPLLGGAASGLTVYAALGIGAGAVAAVVAAWAVWFRSVQRRRTGPPVEKRNGRPGKEIELLYFDGCPNHEAFLPHLRGLLDRAGIHEEVRLRRIHSPEDAARERFLGSPTLRIDGADVEPGASERTDYGMKCRLYRTDSGTAGIPADRWVLDALEGNREEVADARPDRA